MSVSKIAVQIQSMITSGRVVMVHLASVAVIPKAFHVLDSEIFLVVYLLQKSSVNLLTVIFALMIYLQDIKKEILLAGDCLLYTSPSPRD